MNKVYCGDCLEILPFLLDSSVDLIVTSPPYADRRSKLYPSIKAKDYVDWFLPRSLHLLRVLKPTGSFVLNIREHCTKGERNTYVMELVLAMKKQGWKWIEDYVWHKKNSYPGKWPNRFRNSWEYCYHFTRELKFSMYQEAVMVPTGDWAKSRLKNLSDVDKSRDESQVGSGFGKNVSNWKERDMAYPTNVLHMATETRNVGHPAPFPKDLPTWFVKLFTTEGDVVLDPFCGCGTAGVVALELGRSFIGIDSVESYCDLASKNLAI